MSRYFHNALILNLVFLADFRPAISDRDFTPDDLQKNKTGFLHQIDDYV